MKDKINKEIENIISVLETLPTNNKANKEKYNTYLNDQINIYSNKLEDVKKEILLRYNKIIAENTKGNDLPRISELDINFVRCSSSFYDSLEKMNLNHLLYELTHFYNNDLEKVNEVILQIIKEFEKVGVILEVKDFVYSSDIKTYMHALLSKKGNIKKVFEEIFWKTPNFIIQIELNFRYLYLKNEKTITKFFKEHYNTTKLFDYISEYKKAKANEKDLKRSSVKYIFNNFFTGKILPVWLEEKHIIEFNKKYILEESNDTYFNLIKLEESLEEYKNYQSFSFIINHMKELYEKKAEYKDVYDNKLKEISKKEAELFKVNSKLDKKGFFKLKENKLNELKLTRNNIINELNTYYNELKDLKIKDIIFDKVTDDTSHLDLLKLSLTDFNFFTTLLKEQNENMDSKYINSQMIKLYNYIYVSNINIISNVAISEDKNIPQIICDGYRLINIEIDESSLEGDLIKDVIHHVEDMILSRDLKRLNMSIDDIIFVVNVKDKIEPSKKEAKEESKV